MHIHIPDGVLPFNFWATWFALLALALFLVLPRLHRNPKKVVTAAAITAVLLVVFSVEFFGYHLNLTALAGILLGPWFSLLALFTTNVFLALFGHGGVTIIGLNVLINWLEATIGFFLFHHLPFHHSVRAGLVTFIALVVSFFFFLAVLAFSGIDPTLALEERPTTGPVDLAIFAAITSPIIFLSALLEAIVVSLVVSYIHRVRPELIHHDFKDL